MGWGRRGGGLGGGRKKGFEGWIGREVVGTLEGGKQM